MNSEKSVSRLLGVIFLIVAVASLSSGLLLGVIDYSLIKPPTDIATSMQNMAAHVAIMQSSFVVMLFEAVGIVLLAVLLYTVLNTQNMFMARWALGLWIVEAVSLVVRATSISLLLMTSREFVQTNASDVSHFLSLGQLFYHLSQFAYSVLMLFYSVGGLVFYSLFLRSK